MGSKTRLSSYCAKQANNGVNLVMSRKINMRLARPILALDFSVAALCRSHWDLSCHRQLNSVSSHHKMVKNTTTKTLEPRQSKDLI